MVFEIGCGSRTIVPAVMSRSLKDWLAQISAAVTYDAESRWMVVVPQVHLYGHELRARTSV